MKMDLTNQPIKDIAADVLAVGVWGDTWMEDAWIQELDQALDGALSATIRGEQFDGQLGSITSVTPLGRLGCRRLLLVGLAPVPPSPPAARMLAVAAAREASQRGTLAIASPSDQPTMLAALTEGAVTGAYQFTDHISKKPPALEQTVLAIRSQPGDQHYVAVARADKVARLVNLARDLVNTPPNIQTPAHLAESCRKAAHEHGLECTILGEDEIHDQGMGLLESVARGSAAPPRVVHIAYRPAKRASDKRIMLVGKGVTFDSGGLCIKDPQHMPWMKLDMAGAAVALAGVVGAAALELPLEVHAVIGAAENMIGAESFRPGDIVRSKAGATVEIVNTDAEGRLVLADAITYARTFDPTHLIDFGTLTGTAVLALGFNIGAIFCNDDTMADSYLRTAMMCGESHTRLPLSPELEPTLRSTVADLRHAAPVPMGSTITCALFLRRFVGDLPWLHVDFAGPSHLQFPKQHPLHPNGGTGFGVMTTLRFLEQLSVD